MNYMMHSKSIRISFLGDVMCEYTRLPDYLNNGEYDFHSIFASCKDLFSKSDYIVANLETPIAGETLKYTFKDYNFNTPETILEAMRDCGIRMVTTANNHALDRGLIGVDKTIESIRQVGLEFTGTTHSGEMPKPLIVEIQGHTIGFMSYTYGTEACFNGCYLSRKEQYRVNLLKNQELANRIQRVFVRPKTVLGKACKYVFRRIYPRYYMRNIEDYPQKDTLQKRHILNDIKFLKESSADYIIMCLHSGGQFNDQPTKYTQDITEFCIKNGVNIVVGNHEHLIQSSEFFDGAFVAYCLGNYTSNYGIDRKPFDKDAQCSIVLHVDVSNTKEYTISFSVVMSKKTTHGYITIPLYDEYFACNNEPGLKKLINLNRSCVRRLTGKDITDILPQKEYSLNELI